MGIKGFLSRRIPVRKPIELEISEDECVDCIDGNETMTMKMYTMPTMTTLLERSNTPNI